MLGAGTLANPYIIQTPADLQNINNNLTAYYQLGNDIDMTGFNFTPIGRSYPFYQAHLDGKGFKITNLRITSTVEYTGFIARTNGESSVKNLALENIYVESNNHHVAGLIALNYMTTISNCFVTGTIKQTISSKLYAGGLVARNFGLIENCYTDCLVTGGDSVGGFIGHVANELSVINNNYSKSIVTGTKNVGAFFGTTEAVATYQNNFYDSDIAGVSNSLRTGVTGKITAEMKQQSTYTGWDFSTVWYMRDYPDLRIFSDMPISKAQTVSVSSFISNLSTNIETNKKKVITPESTINPIFSIVSLGKSTKRSVEGYSLPIHSQVDISHRTINSRVIDLISTMKPISSDIYRSVVKVTNLTSHMKPLSVDLSVLIPIRNEVINAYVEVVKNGSQAVEIFNNSDLSIIENPSSVEVIE